MPISSSLATSPSALCAPPTSSSSSSELCCIICRRHKAVYCCGTVFNSQCQRGVSVTGITAHVKLTGLCPKEITQGGMCHACQQLVLERCSDEPIPDWPRELQQPAVTFDKQLGKSKLAAHASKLDGAATNGDVKDEDMLDADSEVRTHLECMQRKHPPCCCSTQAAAHSQHDPQQPVVFAASALHTQCTWCKE